MANVDIYIREKNGSREIRVPWLPEEIEYKSGGVEAVEYSIMGKGPVEIPTGAGLRELSWNSRFPGELRTDKSMLRGSWKSPAWYHGILEGWRKSGTRLNVLVTGYPINFDAFLENYDGKASGGFGDLEYELTFKEYPAISVTYTVQKNTSAGTKRPATQSTSYTIKRGDSLWLIAQKMMGSGAKWQTLYQANKTIIESTAKRYGRSSSSNGKWIYPGVVIQIPQ